MPGPYDPFGLLQRAQARAAGFPLPPRPKRLWDDPLEGVTSDLPGDDYEWNQEAADRALVRRGFGAGVSPDISGGINEPFALGGGPEVDPTIPSVTDAQFDRMFAARYPSTRPPVTDEEFDRQYYAGMPEPMQQDRIAVGEGGLVQRQQRPVFEPPIPDGPGEWDNVAEALHARAPLDLTEPPAPRTASRSIDEPDTTPEESEETFGGFVKNVFGGVPDTLGSFLTGGVFDEGTRPRVPAAGTGASPAGGQAARSAGAAATTYPSPNLAASADPSIGPPRSSMGATRADLGGGLERISIPGENRRVWQGQGIRAEMSGQDTPEQHASALEGLASRAFRPTAYEPDISAATFEHEQERSALADAARLRQAEIAKAEAQAADPYGVARYTAERAAIDRTQQMRDEAALARVTANANIRRQGQLEDREQAARAEATYNQITTRIDDEMQPLLLDPEKNKARIAYLEGLRADAGRRYQAALTFLNAGRGGFSQPDRQLDQGLTLE